MEEGEALEAHRRRLKRAQLTGRGRGRRKRCKSAGTEAPRSSQAGPSVILAAATLALLAGAAQGLRITNFRVPAFVPITLAPSSLGGGGQQRLAAATRHPLELAKPILFDCDYEYRPEEDARLVVRWFKDRETEPFYQWLPERNLSTLADWMEPLVERAFVTDPLDPYKRHRSLLIRRLSMNLTGVYTCAVSSLGGQDSRQASLVVFQPPQSFTFKHRIFPAPAPAASTQVPAQREQPETHLPLPVHRPIIHPANNNLSAPNQPVPTNPLEQPPPRRPLYTHDGRPVRRTGRSNLADWQLRQRLQAPVLDNLVANSPPRSSKPAAFQLQVHHFECQASQVTPRPILVLTVKRGATAIAQYMHEHTRTSWHHYQVNQADYYGSAGAEAEADEGGWREPPLPVTLYDITASATVTLNVSLAPPGPGLPPTSGAGAPSHQQQAQLAPVLHFRRGQRMSFECHLEVTGTEFGDKQRININEEEVYRAAELEEQRRRDQWAGEPSRPALSEPQSSNSQPTTGAPLSRLQLIGAAAALTWLWLAAAIKVQRPHP